MSRRRLLCPEVVQTSAMDCGPAALKCLLDGHGLPVSYDRLREACQTEVDGTSIDTVEQIAVARGLVARQIMVPRDHLLLPAASLLPALVILRQPDGMNHFAVAWGQRAGLVQVMDPAVGRRWVRSRRFLDELYLHRMPVPLDLWRAWAEGEGLQLPLGAQLRRLGLRSREIQSLMDRAAQIHGWRGLGALDASCRMLRALLRIGALRRGRAARNLLSQTFERNALQPDAGNHLPADYWSVATASPAEDGSPQVEMRGAVLLQVRGQRSHQAKAARPRPPAKEDQTEDSPRQESADSLLPPELRTAGNETSPQPLRELWTLLREGGLASVSMLLCAVGLAALTVVFEALLIRGLLDLMPSLGRYQRLAACGALVLLLSTVLLLQGSIAEGRLRLGRQLELGLRRALLLRLPLLPDRFLRSRPISDLAERGHSMYRVRHLPALLLDATGIACELVLTAVGLVLLDPSTAPWAMAASAFALGWPLLIQPLITERELRAQIHRGASGRFFLDAMLGAVPIRAHGAQESVRRAHEALVVAWSKAALSLQRTLANTEALQQAAAWVLVGCLLHGHLDQNRPGATLLLVYWALRIPSLGLALSASLRQLPAHRNKMLRLLEPLTATQDLCKAEQLGAEEPGASAAASQGPSPTPQFPGAADEPSVASRARHDSAPHHGAPQHNAPQHGAPHSSGRASGMSLDFRAVSIRAGGHLLLDAIDLHIEAGQHLAMVGPSGAGKSSLAGALLGWHRPCAGEIQVDGELLADERLQRLRRDTVWVDPAVQLWNRSLLDNLSYGWEYPTEATASLEGAQPGDTLEETLPEHSTAHWQQVWRETDLVTLLQALPEGMQTRIGEGGGRLSGGEGQRVRLARAWLHARPRLVILDEPFRGLPRDQRQRLLAKVRRRWSSATLLFITHDLAETRDFERVVCLENGRVAEDDNPDRLLQRPSRYRALVMQELAQRRSLEGAPCWRRLHLGRGKLSELRNSVGPERPPTELDDIPRTSEAQA